MSEPSSVDAPTAATDAPWPRRLLEGLVLRKAWFWAVAIVLCVADLWSKDWAQERFDIAPIEAGDLEGSIERRRAAYQGAASAEIEWWPGVLHFRWAENKGAAFSMASGKSTFLLVVGAITLALLLAFVYRMPPNALGSLILLGLIAGGAVGNIYDRLTFRAVDLRATLDGEANPSYLQPVPAVRDFMYFPFDIPIYSTWGLDDAQIAAGHTRKWPIFNIADIGVTGGVIGLVFAALVLPEPRRRTEDPPPAASETTS